MVFVPRIPLCILGIMRVQSLICHLPCIGLSFSVLNAQAPPSICQSFQLMPIPSHTNGHSRMQRGRFPKGSTQAHLWIWMDTQVSYQEAKKPRSTDPSKAEEKHSSVLWPGLKHKICKRHTVLWASPEGVIAVLHPQTMCIT